MNISGHLDIAGMVFVALGLAICVVYTDNEIITALAAVCAFGLVCWVMPLLLAPTPAGGRAALLPVRYDNRFGAFGMFGVFPGFVIWACICAVTVVAIIVMVFHTDYTGEWWFAICTGATILASARLTYAYHAPAASALRAMRGQG